MSVQRFIAELQQRELLSERQLERLRGAASGRPMSARTLAKFLVQKNHLSQVQATDVLNAVLVGGGDLDAVSTPQSSGFVPDPDEVTLAPIDDVHADTHSDEPSEDAESSNIFAQFLTGERTAPKPTSSRDPERATFASGDEAAPKVAELPDADSPNPEARAGSNGEQPLDHIARVTPVRTTSLSRGKKKKKNTDKPAKRAPKKAKTKGKWDTPLMLVGGGGLVFLILVGGLIWWLMNWESADQKLMQARATRDSGAYSQAIEEYEGFVTSSPRHPEHGLAEIELMTLRIRQPTEAGDFSQALDLAENQLKKFESHEQFKEAHGELAALLPQIAQGLAGQTEKAPPGSAESAKLAELANKALALCNNILYIPKEMRDEGKLTAVRETLDLVARRNATKQALNEALTAMQEAVGAGDTNKSYTTYAQLIRNRPELVGDKSLVEMVAKTTAAEQAAITFVQEEQAAETEERPTPWVASLAIANRRVKPQGAAPSGEAACFLVDGAVYALDPASGQLLWRRYVGGSGATWPLSFSSDVLIADGVHNELLCVEQQSGRLKWRQEINERFAQPITIGERAFVAADSGRLFVIDLKSGTRIGYLQFAQPLRTAPSVDRTNERLYLVGDHSCVYSILLNDLSCLGVFYLGHAEGSVVQSPAAVMDKLAVVVNDGVETCHLRLLKLGEQAEVTGQVAERRLAGLPSAAPLVAGRRLIVVTDRGQIDVYDIGSGEGQEPLTLVATRPATGTKPIVRYAALVDRNIWVGDTQLTKYSVLPTGNRLPVQAIENSFAGATFDRPLAVRGDTLIHARRDEGRAGFVVAATAMAQGRTVWETDLAIPLAGAPVVDDASKSIAVASAEGHLFRLDEAAIRSRIQDEPLAAQAMPATLPALTDSVELGQGRVVFCGTGSNHLLLYNPALGSAAAKWVQLDSPLACRVTPFADGFVAPLRIGQVFYLSSADGSKLATPFQPPLAPNKEWQYQPAGVVEGGRPRFVIADGDKKIYLVELADQPAAHLKSVAEADAGPHPIESPLFAMGDSAIAVGGSSHLLRVKLPALQPAGDANLPAPVAWGPFQIGDVILLATADNQLMGISADGQIRWQLPIEHGDLVGKPLTVGDSFMVSYKKGVLERRAMADGKPIAAKEVGQPLASGPIMFQQWRIVAGNGGSLLVVDQP